MNIIFDYPAPISLPKLYSTRVREYHSLWGETCRSKILNITLFNHLVLFWKSEIGAE